MIDKKERYLASYPGVLNALRDAALSAKRERLGMYELGIYWTFHTQIHLLTDALQRRYWR
jgi:hypothetical protein